VSYNDAAGRYTGKPNTPIYIYRDDKSVACESGEAKIAFLSFTNEYSSESVVNSVYDNICSIANTENAAEFTVTPDPVCGLNKDVKVTYAGDIEAPGSDYNFDWDWNGATVKSGSGIGPYILNWTTAGTKNIRLTVKSNNCGGSTNSSSRTKTVDLLAGPSLVVTKAICEGQSFEGYNTNGIYIDTFASSSGCDSIRTLHLIVTSKVVSTINKTICQGQSFEGYNSTGTYVDTFPSASGCDSIRTLHLSVTSKSCLNHK
jgi:hypothetical protein